MRATIRQEPIRKGDSSMRQLQPDILHCIGNTSLLALRHVVPANGSRILLKLESENPTGSMKNRMALAMVEAAEADGRLKPGGFVVAPAAARACRCRSCVR
jgi:cysteine synthase